MSELMELAVWAYEAELVGEEMFDILADMADDTGRSEDFSVMAALERQTGGLLRTMLVDLGGDPAVAHERAQNTRTQLGALRTMPIEEFFAGVIAGTPEAIGRYERLRELADDRYRPVLDRVIRHEEVLREFAESALRGDEEPARSAREMLAVDPG